MKYGLLMGVLFVIPVCCLSTISLAAPEKRFDPGTQTCREFSFQGMMDGYKTFRNVCKNCHSRDGDGGFLYTESKNSIAWNRVFWEKYPECARDGSWNSLTETDKLKLNDFLFRYGANNYDPNDAACA